MSETSPAGVVVVGAPPAPVLHVTAFDSAVTGTGLDALVAVARRDNPRRAVLVVSRVLGKHLNVAPGTAVAAGAALGELVGEALGTPVGAAGLASLGPALAGGAPPALVPAAIGGPDAIVVGYAETATGLGHLVRRALGPGPMVHTTRALPPAGALVTFGEAHSHAVEHLLFHDDEQVFDPDVTVVLVDDEQTTGRTVMSTIEAIERRAPRRRYLIATLLDWRSAQARAELARFAERGGFALDVVALATATATATVADVATEGDGASGGRPHCSRPTALASPASSPPVGVRRIDVGARPTARRGWAEREQLEVEAGAAAAAAELESRRAGPRALVLGTEELMFVPLLVAAHLSGEVAVRSTTRSPVLLSTAPGYPVVDGVAYPAADATGGPRYLYNLGLDEVDDVFVFCEDADAYLRNPVVAHLAARRRVQVVEVGR
ncbi:MAG: phosphoribosyltransferase domain-containing protein [Acidimicrobiia bacterium]